MSGKSASDFYLPLQVNLILLNRILKLDFRIRFISRILSMIKMMENFKQKKNKNTYQRSDNIV